MWNKTCRNKTCSITALMRVNFQIWVRKTDSEQRSRCFRKSKCFQRISRIPGKIKWNNIMTRFGVRVTHLIPINEQGRALSKEVTLELPSFLGVGRSQGRGFSRQREQQVQRPGDWNRFFLLEEKQGVQCDWSRMIKGESGLRLCSTRWEGHWGSQCW